MATRNRTVEFIQKRNESAGRHTVNVEEHSLHQRLTEPETPSSAQQGGAEFNSSWFTVFDKVKLIQGRIRTDITKLQELHRRHLKPQFNQDEAQEEAEIDRLTRGLQRLFQAAEKAATALEVPQEKNNQSPDETKMLKNMRISLVTQITELSREFRDEQRKYMTELKRQKARVNALSSFGSRSPEEVQEDEQAELALEYMEKGFTQEQIQDMFHKKKLNQERDEDLARIYATIVDLHEMFKDLNALVIQQGSLVDRIDYNIDETATEVHQANKELVEAQKYQKKNTLTIVMLVLLGLIGFFAVMIIMDIF
eukprot:TRINITY_DN28_c0_g1_i1.p1 TRINITY_DN28_c0_g1~~TRINITY_DN28_c0_g1_i1.p1  ORF type:complete len:310 (-),score=30.79 TRINITY_DN28_c0_g1_i1:100-1029(-)